MREQGFALGGTVRGQEKAARLKANGIDAVVFDGTATGPEIGDALADVTHVVLSAAPGDSGPADATLTRLTGLAAQLGDVGTRFRATADTYTGVHQKLQYRTADATAR